VLLVVGVSFFVFYHFHENQLIESMKSSSTTLGQTAGGICRGRKGGRRLRSCRPALPALWKRRTHGHTT